MNPYRMYSSHRKNEILSRLKNSQDLEFAGEALYASCRIQTVVDLALAIRALEPTTTKDYDNIIAAFASDAGNAGVDVIVGDEFNKITKDF